MITSRNIERFRGRSCAFSQNKLLKKSKLDKIIIIRGRVLKSLIPMEEQKQWYVTGAPIRF